MLRVRNAIVWFALITFVISTATWSFDSESILHSPSGSYPIGSSAHEEEICSPVTQECEAAIHTACGCLCHAPSHLLALMCSGVSTFGGRAPLVPLERP
jgi:hypothetical protein